MLSSIRVCQQCLKSEGSLNNRRILQIAIMDDLWESLRTMEFVDVGDWEYESFPWNKGRAGTYTLGPHSEERKRKISMALKGNIPWNKGKKGVQIPSEESKKKMSESHKKRFEDGYEQWNKGQSKYATEEEKLEAKRQQHRNHEEANREEINRKRRERYAANKEEERRKQRERYAARKSN